MTTVGCKHYFVSSYDTGGNLVLVCRLCFTPFIHEHVWVRAGIAGGTGVEDFLWSDYEQCGCGATRSVGGIQAGIQELDAGNYLTLDELEDSING